MKSSRFIKTVQALVCIFVLAVLLPAGRVGAEQAPGAERLELFHEARDFFRQANVQRLSNPAGAQALYQKALLRYERLVQHGVRNGKLFYNIGNVYYRLGDIGRAVINYRRAEQYIPDDGNLQQSLGHVLEQRYDRIEEKEEEKVLKTLFFWHYDVPHNFRMILFSAMYMIFWCGAAAKLFLPRYVPNGALVVLLIFSILFGGSLLVDRFFPKPAAGVLVAPEVVARKGDGLTYQPSFKEPLHAGTEFAMVENRGTWLHIELADGRRCWVPFSSAAFVDDIPSGQVKQST